MLGRYQMNEKDYQNYVVLGKAELKQIQGHQRKIAEYALKVCTIRHGGKSGDLYTLTRYADDLGVNRKTLQNWVQIYKNVILKLDADKKEKASWKAASSVNQILKEDRTLNNQINNRIQGSKEAYKQGVPDERVKKLYDQVVEGKPFETEFITIMQAAKNIRNVLSKRDLNIITDEKLTLLMGILDESSDSINNHLTKKKKRTA